MHLPQNPRFPRDLSPMFLHPKKSSGTIWSRYPTGSVIIKLAQSIIVLLIIITLYNTFPPRHQKVNLDIKHNTWDSQQTNARDKKSTPFQEVLTFGHRLLNSTKSFNTQHLKSLTDWTVEPKTGAIEKNETSTATDRIPEARRITARELMTRPLPKDQTRAPKLMHQSWKDKDLPPKFVRWSETCRWMNPDWEYVLWTDKDNLALVKKYLPWFKKPYRELSSEIYRADAVRNAYMGVFGGVYADLDTECTRPYDTLFSAYNISTAPYTELNQTLPFPPSFRISQNNDNDTDADIDNENSTTTTSSTATSPSPPPQKRKAFLGRMGTDPANMHSIPNAWMASTPGHPFWLLPLQHIAAKLASGPGGDPETITGPASLFETIAEYNDLFHNADFPSLDQHYAGSGWGSLYPAPTPQEELVLLPFWAIYPFSWQRDGNAYRTHCLVGQEGFDARRCKEVLGGAGVGQLVSDVLEPQLDGWGKHQHMEELQDEATIVRKKAEKAKEEERVREEIQEEAEREWEMGMEGYGGGGGLDDDGDRGWTGEDDDDIEDESMLKEGMYQLLEEEEGRLGQEEAPQSDEYEDEDLEAAPNAAALTIPGNPHHLPNPPPPPQQQQQQEPPPKSSALTAPNPPDFGTIAETDAQALPPPPAADAPTNRVQQAAAAASAEEEQQRRLDKLAQEKKQGEDDAQREMEMEMESAAAELKRQHREEGEEENSEELGNAWGLVGDGDGDGGVEEEEEELEENQYVGLLRRRRRRRI